MKKYLIGRHDDTLERSMYPLVFVDDITKDDLKRCIRDGIIIINLIDGTFFDHDSNEWCELESFEKYSDQWNKDGS